MDISPQRALFSAAKAGDLDAVQRFFYDPRMASAIAHANAVYRQVRERALDAPLEHFSQRELWYNLAPREGDPIHGCLFRLIMESDQLNVLEWFVSASACASIADTIRGLVAHLGIIATRNNSVEALEILLDSFLFTELLPPRERQLALESIQTIVFKYRQASLVRVLAAHGANVTGFIHCTPRAFSAVGLDAAVFVEELLRCGVVGLRYKHFAPKLWFKNVETVHVMIDAGVDKYGTPDERSPLHTTVNSSLAVEIVETLITRRFVDVDAPGTCTSRRHAAQRSITPLMLSPSPAIASVLLNYGADIHARDENDRTVLHYVAKRRCNTATLEYFLRLAPDLINAQDGDGITPVFALAKSRHYSPQSLDVLLSSGADPHLKRNAGDSAYERLMSTDRGREYVVSHFQFFPDHIDS